MGPTTHVACRCLTPSGCPSRERAPPVSGASVTLDLAPPSHDVVPRPPPCLCRRLGQASDLLGQRHSGGIGLWSEHTATTRGVGLPPYLFVTVVAGFLVDAFLVDGFLVDAWMAGFNQEGISVLAYHRDVSSCAGCDWCVRNREASSCTQLPEFMRHMKHASRTGHLCLPQLIRSVSIGADIESSS